MTGHTQSVPSPEATTRKRLSSLSIPAISHFRKSSRQDPTATPLINARAFVRTHLAWFAKRRDVYGCGFYRHDARTEEGVGRQADCADQQEVSYRVLHGRTLEER